ncbi:HEAT repeat domain-containing protein [Synechococcus sp. CC9605]|uniref:HEAT repeat domain-containing protein n=1 Tax=Synechococcus sp. (strain CC9605) TaxID=110662 RepID=UPI00005D56FA|nr:HEAT repeat domain-containing protein [Synechococcus sp. CC9605]ABB34194.1 PBS lyase HEAT-like repeat [Synechococcus sp. CC9605]
MPETVGQAYRMQRKFFLNKTTLIPIDSVTSALEALDHQDAGVRYHGAWWLGKNRSVEGVPRLVECLLDERDKTCTGGYPLRRQAARSLGMIKDSRCLPELLKTLETNDVQLHEATLRALIEIKSDQCSSSLISYLDRDIPNKPIEALIEALTEQKLWDVAEKIQPFLKDKSERIVGSAAAFFYSYTGEMTYLNKVISLLDHQNRFIRQSAAFDLARIGPIKAADPILIAKIPNNVKMFAVKAILNKSLSFCNQADSTPENDLESIHFSLFKALDNLARDNFSGNLLIEEDNQIPETYAGGDSTQGDLLSDALENLRSPSLTRRKTGIKQLILGADHFKIDLLDLYFSESDQDITMGLIKAMAELKNPHYANALVNAIGVEIGNHCQGNIRRVAACALGDINWDEWLSSHSLHTVFNKLEWTLHSPEDWGLRYSACLALEGIGNANSIEILSEAKAKETDPVLSARLDKAILKSKGKTSIHQVEHNKISKGND